MKRETKLLFFPRERNTMDGSPLERERRQCSFSTSKITNFLDQGQEETTAKERIYETIRKDPQLYHPRPFDLTLEQAREWSITQLSRVFEYIRIYGKSDPQFIEALIVTLCQYDNSFEFRSGVHFGLFGGAITSQGTPQQIEYWEPLVRNGYVPHSPFPTSIVSPFLGYWLLCHD